MRLLAIDPSFNACGWYIGNVEPMLDGEGVTITHHAHGGEKLTYPDKAKTSTAKHLFRGESFALIWMKLVRDYNPSIVAAELTLASQNMSAIKMFAAFTFAIPAMARLSSLHLLPVTPNDVKRMAKVNDDVDKAWAIKRWTGKKVGHTKVDTTYALFYRHGDFLMPKFANLPIYQLEAVADAYSVAYAAVKLNKQFLSKFF